jgi:hypothetical protein
MHTMAMNPRFRSTCVSVRYSTPVLNGAQRSGAARARLPTIGPTTSGESRARVGSHEITASDDACGIGVVNGYASGCKVARLGTRVKDDADAFFLSKMRVAKLHDGRPTRVHPTEEGRSVPQGK